MDKFNRINYMINDKHKCLQETVIMIAMICLIVYVNGNKKMDGRIYILMWTPSNESPFTIMEMEQKSFTKRNCRFQNCFLTNNTLYFNDVRDFDVILFNAVNLVDVRLPTNRSKAQKYVFASRESPVNFPIPSRYKDVFNVTWTYRLDSDINFAFIVVKNKKGKVIGPSKKVHWMNNNKMKQAPESVISNLRNKKTAAAWLVSHCDTPSQREMFVQKLIKETSKYQLKIDIFGWCGDLKCPKDRMEECYALIESDYYFYLSFENSFCEDYVTEKLLTALKHYAIPIVYGGANYTRFMPGGMYLDAVALGEEKLAKMMNDIIEDKNKYYDYFKWHRYYSFHATNESADTDEICAFCAFLNDDNRISKTREYNIRDWWISY